MSTLQISELPNAAALADGTLFAVNQGAGSRKDTLENLSAYILTKLRNTIHHVEFSGDASADGGYLRVRRGLLYADVFPNKTAAENKALLEVVFGSGNIDFTGTWDAIGLDIELKGIYAGGNVPLGFESTIGILVFKVEIDLTDRYYRYFEGTYSEFEIPEEGWNYTIQLQARGAENDEVKIYIDGFAVSEPCILTPTNVLPTAPHPLDDFLAAVESYTGGTLQDLIFTQDSPGEWTLFFNFEGSVPSVWRSEAAIHDTNPGDGHIETTHNVVVTMLNQTSGTGKLVMLGTSQDISDGTFGPSALQAIFEGFGISGFPINNDFDTKVVRDTGPGVRRILRVPYPSGDNPPQITCLPNDLSGASGITTTLTVSQQGGIIP